MWYPLFWLSQSLGACDVIKVWIIPRWFYSQGLDTVSPFSLKILHVECKQDSIIDTQTIGMIQILYVPLNLQARGIK